MTEPAEDEEGTLIQGLHLPFVGTMGLSDKAVNDTTAQWTTYPEVFNNLVKQGLGDVLPPRDLTKGLPVLTGDMLNNQNPKEYGLYFVQFNEWLGYVAHHHAHLDAQILECENILQILEAQIRQEAKQSTKKYTKEDISDFILLRPEHQKVSLNLQKLKQEKGVTTATLQYLDRSLKVLSRQIEVRKIDLEAGRLTGNLQNRGREYR